MNPCNVIHLEGRIEGMAWRRWKPCGGGEVRFRLAVPSEKSGVDVFTCAVVAPDYAQADRLEVQLAEGRAISLQAQARVGDRVATRDEPLVLFVVDSYEFDRPAAPATTTTTHSHRQRAYGKAAAAGDAQDAFQLS